MFGDKKYANPKYVLTNTMVKDVNESGKFYVYTIVLFEKSPQEFQEYPEKYYHYFEHQSDTGLKMELLQKYLFIPLDIFQKNAHNVDI
ncbi:MAG: hypothetical protein NC489_30965 [Ruminococcus flavefaciens]|nr:hypothetical protein [Ruminococcus flavefaciens]